MLVYAYDDFRRSFISLRVRAVRCCTVQSPAVSFILSDKRVIQTENAGAARPGAAATSVVGRGAAVSGRRTVGQRPPWTSGTHDDGRTKRRKIADEKTSGRLNEMDVEEAVAVDAATAAAAAADDDNDDDVGTMPCQCD